MTSDLFPRIELPRRPDGSVDEAAIRAQLIRGCVSYVVTSEVQEPSPVRHVALNFHKDAFSNRDDEPHAEMHWPEPTTPFLLRRVPTLLVYALTFVVYGLLIAILTNL